MLAGCAAQPQRDRAAEAAAFRGATEVFVAQTFLPALRFCAAQQAGAVADPAQLTAAGFAAANSATLSKTTTGNVGMPPGPASAFVVLTDGCSVRTNGVSIARSEIAAATGRALAEQGFAPVDEDAGLPSGSPPTQVFRKGAARIGVAATSVVTDGMPFVNVAIRAL